MPVRSIWNGAIAFGDVVVAVKLFAAVQEHSVHFHEVRLRDGCPVIHRRVGADSGREVPAERIGKAYESSRGHQVVLEAQEIAAAEGSRPKVIEIEHFVAAGEIDPVYYDHPYIVGAQDGGERAYRVLHGALRRSRKVGIGRFVLRTREQLVALAPRGSALELYTMRFADEVVDHADLDVPALRRAPSRAETEMAQRLIETLAGPWRPSSYKDRYRAKVLAVIKRKADGKKVEAPAYEPTPPTVDLLAALQQSVDAGAHRKRGKQRARSAKTAAKAATKTRARAR
jgi:DNA end-binding protein Ku